MHCPRCGQQQVSNETKFCSRCGFLMSLIPHLIANAGTLPELEQLNKPQGIFTRRNGLIFTALWFIFFVLMLPAFGGLADIEEVSAVSAVFGIFSTMMLFIVSIAFLKGKQKPSHFSHLEALHRTPQTLHTTQPAGTLPAGQSIPAQVYAPPQQGSWRAPDTGEFTSPGTVTDSTTKLLSKDE